MKNGKCKIRRIRSTGFTLVELLVVIGIIALLISILLPALGRARRAANTVVCSANLKSVTFGMLMYANQYHGAILGNASTSAAFLVPPYASVSLNNNNIPYVNQVWDWTSPVAKTYGAKFNEGPMTSDRQERFIFMSNYGGFQCPENSIVQSAYSLTPSGITGAVKMCSFSTAYYFQVQYLSGANGAVDPVHQGYLNSGNYFPKLSNVGDTSQKIFMFDSAKFTLQSGTAPDYNLDWSGGGSPGGQYSDTGPWDSYTRSFLPGTPIVLSMRHGDRKVGPVKPSAGFNSSRYRLNVAFFDGHVETLDGHRAMNPGLWVPKGTVVTSSEMDPSGEAYKSYVAPNSSFIAP